MSAAACGLLQAADIYQVQVFRGQLRQMTRMISSWGVRVPAVHRRVVLAKLGSEVSRRGSRHFLYRSSPR